MLGSSTRTVLFLLVCTSLMADSKYKVLGMRGREFFLEQTQGARTKVQTEEVSEIRIFAITVRHAHEDHATLRQKQRVLEEVVQSRMNEEKNQEPKNDTASDQYQSSKRRVRRGSDPIHNKS